MFKRHNHPDRSPGILILGVGIVWMLLQSMQIQYTQHPVSFDRATLIYGTLAGLSVATANLMLVVALRSLDVSLGSTIYRLNTIGVVVLSVLFLGEALSAIKLSGIAFGIIAVLLLHNYRHAADKRALIRLGLLVAVTASLLRAVFGVVSKAGLSEGADPDTLILVYSACWIIIGLGYAVLIEQRRKISAQELGYACLAGLLLYGVVTTLVAALELGEATVVVPIANMSFVVALFIATIAGMEKMNGRKSIAIVFAIGAIALLTYA